MKALLTIYLKTVVAGLLASSAILLVSKFWAFKLPVLMGLGVLLWVNHHAVFSKVPTLKLLDNTELCHALGVIGAIIYLLGAECGAQKVKSGN